MQNVSHCDPWSCELPDSYLPRHYAPIWQAAPGEWRDRLTQAIERAAPHRCHAVFFRADDIGAGGRAFEALCRLFRYHQAPLAMAVVPGWLSGVRTSRLFQVAPLEEPLWNWHQHGWRHVNWQRVGKKSEFGEQRPFDKQWRDIHQGRRKMREIFGDCLVPVFTPPWNRASHTTLKILEELEFKGVSMTGPFPRGYKAPANLKNLRVQIDLHTRKEKDGAADFQDLLDEIPGLLGKKEPVGIMIHHQRMTCFAFEFLHELLALLKNHSKTRLSSFRDILEKVDDV